jgi:D-beta-D-heptose 7-phosphate kinase/D-beta-D-heptose 1-phosphate adenosyltransferase
MSLEAPEPLVVMGDALLDRDLEGTVERLSPEAPVPVVDDPVERSRAGGAGLAAALAAAAGERPVTLVTALARDTAGDVLRGLIQAAGIDLIDMGLDGRTPEKVRVRGSGRTLLRLDREGRGPSRVLPSHDALAAAGKAIGGAAAVLVSDYGRGVSAVAGLRDGLRALPASTPVVWDPHPKGPAPVEGMALVTPNAVEAAGFLGEAPGNGTRRAAGADPAVAASVGAELCRRWRAANVCMTRGSQGAVLTGADGSSLTIPAPQASSAGDACGAGDRFAAKAALALAAGALPSKAVAEAVAEASAFVAGGGAGRAAPEARSPDASRGAAEVGERAALAIAERTRARGGTVVATGGCFDLLHAGHVSLLRAARALGDCLIVLLNSDASMRRLKGPDRPLVKEGDRAAVLAALDAVDAVTIFAEDTPADALERLKPDIFAKGGDYAGRELPEAEALERVGGRVVVLPYVAGRSTTRLIEEVALRGGR